MSNTFKLLTYFDLNGLEPLLFVKEKTRFKSFSGGIQTLIFFIIVVIFIGIEIDKYLNTTSPQDLEVVEFYPEYQAMLNRSNYFLAYSFSFDNLKNKFKIFPDFDLEEYIKSTVIIHYGKYDYQKFKDDVSNSFIVNCTEFNFEELEISNFTKNELINKAFCIDLNNSIMNVSEDNGYSTLEISVYLNNTYFDEYIIARNISEIENNEMENILNNYNFELNIYYQSILSSPSVYTKIANKKRINKEKREFTLIDYNMHYFFSIKKITSMKRLDFLRNGKYSKNNTYFNAIHTDVISPYVEFYNEGCKKLMTYTYTLDTTHTVHILKYPNFFEICSEIGGAFNIIFTILKVIFHWIQKFEEIHYLSYKCFSNKLYSDKSLKSATRQFSIKNYKCKEDKNNPYNLNKNLHAIINDRSHNFLVNNDKINSDINLNSNIIINRNDIKNIPDNRIIISNKNQRESTNNQVLSEPKIISLKNKEINIKHVLGKNKLKKYDWKKEIWYIFCNECNNESKSIFINLFQTFLSIENIMRWNQEWVSFKIAELDSLEQLAMKYIDVDKIKLENNLHPFERNEEELNEIIKKLKEKNHSTKKYGNLEKLLL